jgi:small subunit ribosomal protein S21
MVFDRPAGGLRWHWTGYRAAAPKGRVVDSTAAAVSMTIRLLSEHVHDSTGSASAVQDALRMVLRMRVREGEPIGLALRRFKKLLDRSGIAKEVRKRKHFVPDSQRRRKKEFLKWLKARLETEQGKRSGR